MTLLKKVQLLPIKAQILSRPKVQLFGFDPFFQWTLDMVFWN